MRCPDFRGFTRKVIILPSLSLSLPLSLPPPPDDEPPSSSHSTAAIVITVVVIAVLGLFLVGGVLIGKEGSGEFNPCISVLDTTLNRPEENPVISGN